MSLIKYLDTSLREGYFTEIKEIGRRVGNTSRLAQNSYEFLEDSDIEEAKELFEKHITDLRIQFDNMLDDIVLYKELKEEEN